MMRGPLEEPLDPPLELLLRHLLPAGHLDQGGPRRGVLRRQFDRLLGQALRLVEARDEGAHLLLAGLVGEGGTPGGPCALQRELGADGVDDRVGGSGGEPLLDPLRVVDGLLREHPEALVADVDVAGGVQQGGGLLPLTPAGGAQGVGQVDVVPDGVHGDDLVGPELALHRGAAAGQEGEEPGEPRPGEDEHPAGRGEAGLAGQGRRLHVRRDQPVGEPPDGDQQRRVGHQHADRPDAGRVEEERRVRTDADEAAQGAAGDDVHEGEEQHDDDGGRRHVRARGVQGHASGR
jgi:hypothetical protein